MDDDIGHSLLIDLDELWFLSGSIVFGEDGERLEILIGAHRSSADKRHSQEAIEARENSNDEQVPVVTHRLEYLVFSFVDLNQRKLVLYED